MDDVVEPRRGEVLEPGKYPVHPHAEAFMMMPPDELEELAVSIAKNGLRQPIVIDQDHRLVDGRNRQAACQMAGVEPTYETKVFADDKEVAAFVLDNNIHRRHIMKGQRAMAEAFMYPEPEASDKGGRGKKKTQAVTAEVSSRRLREARQVLRHSRELAEEVKLGLKTLDAALKEVQEAQQERETDGTKFNKLQAEAPDLADLVSEERMTLEEAYAAWQERERRNHQTYQAGVASAQRFRNFLLDATTVLSAMALLRQGGVEDPDDTLKKILTEKLMGEVTDVVVAVQEAIDNQERGEDSGG